VVIYHSCSTLCGVYVHAATVNLAGVIKRNKSLYKAGEGTHMRWHEARLDAPLSCRLGARLPCSGLEHNPRVEPPIRLAAEKPPSTPLHYAAALVLV